MSLLWLCPGQGAQRPGYLHRLPAHSEVSRTLDEAGAVLGRDPLGLDASAALQSTVDVQLGLLIAAVACGRALRAQQQQPDLLAGMSLGAFSAAVLADALDFADALRLVRLRASAMQAAWPQDYGMAAISGLTQRPLQALIDAINAELDDPLRHAHLANLNASTQFVVAGHAATLAQLMDTASAAGARSAQRLDVAVPSHCALLQPVASQLRAALAGVTLRAPRWPLLGNATARLLRSADAVAQDLADGVMGAVRWSDGMELLVELGVTHAIEMPPGQQLGGLLRAASCRVRTLALAEQGLESALLLGARAD